MTVLNQYFIIFVLQFKFGLRDGLILLVDCSKSMFDKENDDDESFFQLCMRVSLFVFLFSLPEQRSGRAIVLPLALALALTLASTSVNVKVLC